VLGGLLVDGFGWPAAFVFRAPLFLIVALLALTRFGRVAGAAPTPRRLALADLLRLPVLRAGTLAFLSQYAQFAVWLLMPFFLVTARGLSPSVGGVVFVLTPLATALAAPLGGLLTDRIGPRWPLRIGLALEAAGLLAIGAVSETTPIALLGVAMALVGFGAGLFQVPNLALMMAAFPPAQQGAAGGLAFLGRTLGSAVGVQATALLFAARLPRDGFLAAFHAAFLAAGLVCVLAAALALLPARSSAPRGGR
jgi:MFS family permease